MPRSRNINNKVHSNKRKKHSQKYNNKKKIKYDHQSKYNNIKKQNNDIEIHQRTNTYIKNNELNHNEKIDEDINNQVTEEEIDPYQELLSTFDNVKTSDFNSVLSDDSEDDDDDDEKNEKVEEIEEPAQNIVDGKELSDEDEQEEEEEDVEDVEITKEEELIEDCTDPFLQHFEFDLDENLLKAVSAEPVSVETIHDNWKTLGNLLITIPKSNNTTKIKTSPKKLTVTKVSIEEHKIYAKEGTRPAPIKSFDWSQHAIKSQLHNNISRANRNNLDGLLVPFTPLQTELFSIINQYQDIYYSERNFKNCEEIRFIYCLHALNHILKTRGKILNHNAKLAKKSKDTIVDYQDQGLIRPKVLILVPFRNAAYRVIHTLIDIMTNDEKATPVMHSKRFEEEFTGDELDLPKKNPKPEDYQQLFNGNTDDNFRIGISIVGKTFKLYADFYSSDILIASPLGLRLIIGADGEKDRDYDFLASIELLVIDQADVFFMQNWDHVLHLMRHMHLQPKDMHGTDLSRVRSWAINGWTKYYRQSLIFSSQPLAQINSLLTRYCFNYSGKVIIRNSIEPGTLCQILVTVPQMFQRIEATSPSTAPDCRFETLIKRILPNMNTNHILIFVPSYYDYVRIRNYLKREDISFVQICEYSKDAKIARARDLFYHTESRYLLYSERMHFFRRLRLKGIRHLIFYQPPTYPTFYSEMVNLMQEANQNPRPEGGSASEMSVSVLFTRYDAHQLAGIVGTTRAKRLLNAIGNIHVFTNSEDTV